MRQFPALWLTRLNEMVKGVRRRQGWGDIQAVVEPAVRADHPPLLRLEKAGTLLIEPLDPRTIEQVMRTGQEGPLLVDIKQAFLRLLKSAHRREKASRALEPRKGRP